MSSWLYTAVILFAFHSCDTNVDPGTDEPSKSNQLYPTSISERFEVCCRIAFENSFPQTERPNLISIGEDGQYLLTDGQTFWSYDQSGVKLLEKTISESEQCAVTKRKNGFSYTCTEEGNTDFIEVDELGNQLSLLRLDALTIPGKLYSVPQEGPLLFREGDPFTVGGTNGDVVKIDQQGNEQWSYQFDGEAPIAFIWPENEELMIAGSYRNPDTLKAWSIAIQNTGDTAWEKKTTACRYCELTDVFDLGQDRYLWFGSRAAYFENNGNMGYHSRLWMEVTNASNQELWATNASLDYLTDGLVYAKGDEDGLEIVAGSWVTLRLDGNGDLAEIYEWPIQLPESCRGEDIIRNKEGDFVLLLACGVDRAINPTTGESWAEIAILK